MKVFIVAAKRTPIGSFNGALKTVSPVSLGATAVASMLDSVRGVKPNMIDEVIVGNVIGAGQGMGLGRQVALRAGIPDSVPAYTLNMVCGSGMKAIMDACAHIKSGDASIVVAAGTESMSQIPYALPGNARWGTKPGHLELRDLLVSDGLTDAFHHDHMGLTAENVAKKLGITRAQQDEFALLSQTRAAAAQEHGRFEVEIAPVDFKIRQGRQTLTQDEYLKPDTTLERLSQLKPAFSPEGTVTAGNASGLNDGASALMIASEAAVREHRLTPLAEIISYYQAGITPELMGLGPVAASQGAMARAGLHLNDIDLFECNEAFAAQALGVIHELCRESGVPVETFLERTNVNGGAIALGHPLGASGNRIVVSMLYEMRRRNARHGLATLCIGGGMGTAVILKNV